MVFKFLNYRQFLFCCLQGQGWEEELGIRDYEKKNYSLKNEVVRLLKLKQKFYQH